MHLLEAHYRTRLCQQGYGPYPGGQTPSSGLLAAYVMMQLCRKVTGYGFGGTADAAGAGGGGRGGNRMAGWWAGMSRKPPPYHYWTGTGARSAGNEESHSFSTEAWGEGGKGIRPSHTRSCRGYLFDSCLV